MSKASKTMLIIATVLVIGGSALSFGAFAAAGFNPENLSTESRTWTSNTKSFPLEKDAAKAAFTLHDGGQNVRVESTDGDAIEVTYWTNEHKSYDVSERDGSIAVEARSTPYIGVMMFGSSEDHTTVVKVPRSYSGSLSVNIGAGRLDASDLDGLSSIELIASSGEIVASKLEAAALDLKASVGSIDASNLHAERASVTVDSGSIDLADVDATGSIRTSSSIGDQRLSRLRAPSIDARSSSGGIDAFDLDGDDISIETSIGDIDATVAGAESDFAIEASASVGDVDAPRGSTGAAKRIVLRASSGSIDLGFSHGSSTSSSTDSDSSDSSSAPAAPASPAAPSAPAAPAAPTA